MKSNLIFLFLILSVSRSFSQVYATTDDGKRVLLRDDSTWQYLPPEEEPKDDTVSVRILTRPISATTLKASKQNKFGIWIDEKKWKSSSQLNSSAEFNLVNTGKFEEAFCIAITERVEISLEMLKKQVVANMKENTKNYQLLKSEYLTVNHHKVLHIVSKGEVDGVHAEYSGYYSTDVSGVIQVLCFTSDNLFAKYEKDFNELLNGLVVTK
jgi:hypothetical protein